MPRSDIFDEHEEDKEEGEVKEECNDVEGRDREREVRQVEEDEEEEVEGKKDDFLIQRYFELEDKLGDLLMSEFLADRMRAGLARKIEGYQHKAAGYYYRDDRKDPPLSAYEFRYKDKSYSLSIEVDEITVPNRKSSRIKRLQKFIKSFSLSSKRPSETEKEKL